LIATLLRAYENLIQITTIVNCYTFTTPSHLHFLDAWMRPSLPEELNLVIRESDTQLCPTATFRSVGWRETMIEKVKWWIHACEHEDIFIGSDVDVQFFAPVADAMLEALGNLDFAVQNQRRQDINSGFFICRGNDRTLKMWNTILGQLKAGQDDGEQYLLQAYLEKHPDRWTFLPADEFYTPEEYFINLSELKVPGNIRMHHATYAKGTQDKIQQLQYVRQIVNMNRSQKTLPSPGITPKISIVVTPRQRFDLVETCLESIYAFTKLPFELIFVAPKVPKKIEKIVHRFQSEHANFKVLHLDRYVHPFEAKNIASDQIHTEAQWVVFIDNDVEVHPGWIDALLRAGEETGAGVVHPLYLMDVDGRKCIHMAEGTFEELEHGLEPVMQLASRPVSESAPLQRKRSGFVEFHAFMIRRNVLRTCLPFEPLTLSEHLNFSMHLAEKGETIIFEPESVVTYIDPSKVDRDSGGYHGFRWDLELGESSIATLKKRWPMAGNYFERNIQWMRSNFERSKKKPRRWKRWLGLKG